MYEGGTFVFGRWLWLDGLARAFGGEVSVGGSKTPFYKCKNYSRLEQIARTGCRAGSDRLKRIWAKRVSSITNAYYRYNVIYIKGFTFLLLHVPWRRESPHAHGELLECCAPQPKLSSGRAAPVDNANGAFAALSEFNKTLPGRLELPTLSLTASRSNQLS